MKISEQGLDFIKSFEGLRLTAYWDPNGGVWTIGWGTSASSGFGRMYEIRKFI